jgi:hypothetical protein
VLFAARNDGDPESPAPQRKSVSAPAAADPKASGGLLSPKLKRAVMTGLQKVFRKKKTDYLSRLTRHLLREDEGEHWPAELDFELTGGRPRVVGCGCLLLLLLFFRFLID